MSLKDDNLDIAKLIATLNSREIEIEALKERDVKKREQTLNRVKRWMANHPEEHKQRNREYARRFREKKKAEKSGE